MVAEVLQNKAHAKNNRGKETQNKQKNQKHPLFANIYTKIVSRPSIKLSAQMLPWALPFMEKKTWGRLAHMKQV